MPLLTDLNATERALVRRKKLDALLAPIEWNWESSIRARQNYVGIRRNAVATALPFLTDEELARAYEWLEKERHEGLWD